MIWEGRERRTEPVRPTDASARAAPATGPFVEEVVGTHVAPLARPYVRASCRSPTVRDLYSAPTPRAAEQRCAATGGSDEQAGRRTGQLQSTLLGRRQ